LFAELLGVVAVEMVIDEQGEVVFIFLYEFGFEGGDAGVTGCMIKVIGYERQYFFRQFYGV
jgi:hypothetical protein